MFRDQNCSMWNRGQRGQSGSITKDLRGQAEELGLYPEGSGELCKGFKEELHAQLDVLESWH